MKSFAIEIRDRKTFIGAVATLLESDIEQEQWIIKRLGYRDTRFILLTNLVSLESQADPYLWRSMTMQQTHLFLLKNINILTEGMVIDTEYLRGETSLPKTSERFG